MTPCVAVVALGLLLTPLAAAGTGAGSRSHPYRIRTTHNLRESGGWQLRVNKSIPNATRIVMAENQFNDPPKSGHQFFMISITLKNGGKKVEDAFSAITLSAVGRSNVAYEPGSSDSCGVIRSELDEFKTVFPGGKLTGNICFSVRKRDAARLLLYYEPEFSLNDTQVFFALR
jgi:hypothetical protein